jgi:hypothetical protein
MRLSVCRSNIVKYMLGQDMSMRKKKEVLSAGVKIRVFGTIGCLEQEALAYTPSSSYVASLGKTLNVRVQP